MVHAPRRERYILPISEGGCRCFPFEKVRDFCRAACELSKSRLPMMKSGSGDNPMGRRGLSDVQPAFPASSQPLPAVACRSAGPWAAGASILLNVRRFRCASSHCRTRIFSERMDHGVTRPYARRTSRMQDLVRHLGRALGGRPAQALAERLHLRQYFGISSNIAL